MTSFAIRDALSIALRICSSSLKVRIMIVMSCFNPE